MQPANLITLTFNVSLLALVTTGFLSKGNCFRVLISGITWCFGTEKALKMMRKLQVRRADFI